MIRMREGSARGVPRARDSFPRVRRWVLCVLVLSCGSDDIHFTHDEDVALIDDLEGTYANGSLSITVCAGVGADVCTEGSIDGCDSPCHVIGTADETLENGKGCQCANPKADLGVMVDAGGVGMVGVVSTAPEPGNAYAAPHALHVHVPNAGTPSLNGEVRSGALLLRYVGDAGFPADKDTSVVFTKTAGHEACP